MVIQHSELLYKDKYLSFSDPINTQKPIKRPNPVMIRQEKFRSTDYPKQENPQHSRKTPSLICDSPTRIPTREKFSLGGVTLERHF